MKRRSPWLSLLALVGGAIGSYYLAQTYLKARAACPPFRKRTYTSREQLLDAFGWVWRHPEALRSLNDNREIGLPLVRKMALAVAGVNGNRYAGSTRALAALGSGLGRDERESLLRGELAYATANEAPAIVFARRYAEQRGQPEADMLQQLSAQYDARTAQDIITCTRLVNLASLVGNTVDALVSRALGQPSAATSLAEELAILLMFGLGMAPLLPVLAYRSAHALDSRTSL